MRADADKYRTALAASGLAQAAYTSQPDQDGQTWLVALALRRLHEQQNEDVLARWIKRNLLTELHKSAMPPGMFRSARGAFYTATHPKRMTVTLKDRDSKM
jgi:hypothetical protein